MTEFAQWVHAMMIAFRVLYAEAEPAWVDTYDATAIGIASACAHAPLPGGGRVWCAGVLVGMGWHESRFNPEASHDAGAGFGIFGTQEGTLGRPVPEDPEGQAQAALELLQVSFRICAKHPLDERLGWYAAGGTGCERRLDLSRFRLHEVARLLREHPLVEVDLNE